MSTVVDSKVVEMKFDNQQFERETRTTMKTLDKLKDSLNFDQSSKGLDKLAKSADAAGSQFQSMGKAVEQISVKMSAMEVIGTTALVNLTNKVVNAGEKLVKSMTIDQVTAGWQKYADKTSAVQTLLNSTGKSLGEINKYLDTLQWYSDETSYGFTDMTQALSSMTIAGGKIEKLTPMIMGIANATAFAGKGAREFKSIMYNLSQSYSKGSLQTIDWKSVQLMGGASVQLKEALVQQAIALGELKKGSTSKNFDQYLTDHVFTTDVMEAAFLQFSDYTELVRELVNKFGVEATDLNQEIIPQLVEAKKKGTANLNEVVEKNKWQQYLPYLNKMEKLYDGLGKKAFLAAQEAKTFGEAVAATKDAVSSEFAKIFEAIFGDYYKAKELWTGFVNWLSDVIVEPLTNIREKIETIMKYSPVQELKDFASALNKIGANSKTTAKSLSYYQKMVNNIWRGDYNNQPYRKGLLEKEGHNFKVLQSLVNLGYQHKLTTEEVIKAEKKYGKGIVENAKNLDKMTDKELLKLGLTKDQVKMYRELSAAAKEAGVSVKDYINTSIEDSKDKALTGRDLFIGIFTNIGNALTNVLFAIREAFGKAFSKKGTDPVKSAYNVLYALYSVTKKISDFFNKDRNRYDKNGKEIKGYTNNYTNLVSTLKGLFSILSLITTIMKIGLKIAFGVVRGVLKAFGFTLEKVLEITGAVGETIFNIVKFIEKSIIGTVIDTLVDILVALIDVVAELLTYSNPLFKLIAKIKNAIIGFFKSISKYIKSDKAKKAISDIGKTLGNVLKTSVTLLGTAISKTIDWITHNKVILSIVDAIRKAFTNAAKAIHDWIKSGEAGNAVAKAFNNLGKAIVWVINALAKGINAIINWAKNSKTLQMIVKTLGNYLSIMFKTIGNWLSKIDLVSIFTKIGKTISKVANKIKNWIVNNTKLVEALKSLWEWLKKTGNGFANWFSGIKESDNIPKYIIDGLVNGLKGGLKAVITAISTLASGIINTFAKILKIHSPSRVFADFGINIGQGLFNGIKSIWSLCTGVVESLGIAIINVFKNLDIGSVLATIITIGAVVTLNKVSKALLNFSKPFAAFAGVLNAVKTTILTFNDTLKAIKVKIYAESAKSIAAAVLLIAGAIYLLAKIDDVGKAWSAVGMITVILAAISGVLLAIAKMNANKTIKETTTFAAAIGAIAGLMLAVGAMALLVAIALKKVEGLKNPLQNVLLLFGPIVAMLVIIGAMLLVSRKFGLLGASVSTFEAIAKVFGSMGKMLLILAIAMRIVGKIPVEKMGILEYFVESLVILLAGVLLLTIAASQLSLNDAKKLNSITGLTKSLTSMIISLTAAIVILSKMKPGKFKDGIVRLGLIMGLVLAFYALTIVINKIGDKGVNKNTISAITKMVAAIAILALVVGVLGLMSRETLMKGIKALGLIMIFVIVLYAVIATINSKVEGPKSDASKTLIRVAMALAILAGVAIILGLIPDEVLNKGMKVVTQLSVLVAGLMAVSSMVKPESQKGILAIAGILAVLAIAVLILGNMKFEKLAAGTGALSILIGMLILLFKSLNKLEISKETAVALAIMGGMIAVLGMVLFALSFLPAKKTIPAAIALSLLIGVLILAFKKINSIKVGKKMGDKLVYLLTLTVIMIGLAAALRLAGSNSWDQSIAAAAGIGLLLSVLVVSLSALSKGNGVNLGGAAMIKTIIMLAVLVGVAAGLAWTLSLVKDPNGAIQSATAISILLGVMVAVLLVLAKMENLVPKAKNGIIGLAALTVILIGIAFAVSLVKNVNNSIEIIKQLSLMLIVLTSVLAVLTVIGMAKTAAFYGIAALAALILAIVGIAGLLGLLIKSDKTITKGLNILVLIAKKIGEAIAAFVGAILNMVTDTLPKLGKALSKFAIYVLPFINIMKTVNAKVLAGVGIMAASIIAMCVAELFAAITKILTLGGSFADIGTELSTFAKNSEDFIKYGKEIPTNLSKNMLNLAKAILAIAAGDFLDKLSKKLFGGDSAIKRFSDNLPLLGEGLRSFVDELGEFDSSTVTTVDCASQAVSKLAKASKDLPRSGGWLQKLVGGKDLGKFTKNLKPLGVGINDFRKALGGKFTDEDSNVVRNAANAVASLAKAANDIPSSGGDWQKKYGGKDLGKFANDIGDTGEGLRIFRNKIGDWDNKDLTLAQNGASLVSTFAQSARMIIGSLNGFSYKTETDGEHIRSLAAFSNDIPTLGEALTEFVKVSPDTSIEGYTEKIKNFERIIEFMNSISKILANDFVSAATEGKLVTVKQILNTIIVESIKSLKAAMEELSKTPENMGNIDTALENIEKVLAVMSKIAKLDHKAVKEYADDIKTITSSALSEEVKTAINALIGAGELDESDKRYKAFEEDAKKVGEAVINGINKGIVDSKDKNLIAQNIIDTISDTLKVLGGTSSSLIANVAYEANLTTLGITLIENICTGIKSEQSKKNIMEAFDTAMKYINAQISEINYDGFTTDKLKLKLTKIDVILGKKDDTIKNELTNRIKEVLDNIITDLETGIEIKAKITPVVNWDEITKGKLSNLNKLITVNTNLNTNLEALKKSFGTDLSKQTDRIVEKLGSVEKSIKSIDGANYTYTVNIDGDTMNGNADVKNAFNSLVKALNINKKSG